MAAQYIGGPSCARSGQKPHAIPAPTHLLSADGYRCCVVQIWVTENRVSVPNEESEPLPKVLNDTFRQDYFK